MKILLLLSVLMLVGCVKPKSEMNVAFLMQPEEIKVLEGHCSDINANGDILQLLREIKHETSEALSIMENPGKGARIRLGELSDSISLKSEKITNLSKPEWTTERWNHEVIWRLGERDFKGLGTRVRNGFQLLGAEIDSLYFMGQKNAHLAEKVTIVQGESDLEIKFKGMASSLELCQLQKTMFIVLDVNTRSLGNERHQYFSLFVR